MRLFRFNPTIREANRYLNQTVEELLKKHGGVSKEDFERDLVAATGIGWKQVKNYKNHPKPSERLKDNAIVLKYVLQKRSQNTGRKARHYLVYASTLLFTVSLIYMYLSKPNEIEQFIVHEVPPSAHTTDEKETRIFLKLLSRDWLFRLGPLDQSRVPLDQFNCVNNTGAGTKLCSFNQTAVSGNFQAFLLLDGGVIRRYSILSFDPGDVANLTSQLSKLLGDKIKHFPAINRPIDEITVDLGNESVRLSRNQPTSGSPFVSVVVTLN